MKNSAERIQYITDYLSSYEAKINALNKAGLLDSATLFEIFAQNICRIWFGQKFSNLNDSRSNFPYVDLISEDKKLYVQVSTTNSVPNKIKHTLEKIKNNESDNSKNIEKLYFVTLSNASIKNIKDYCGESRIGKIDFKASENLITTDNILSRAKEDMDFQIALFNILWSESNSLIDITNNLSEAIDISKKLMNSNIDCLINNEYTIDRSDDINKIKNENCNFISIQGEAGCGKSALCKIMLKDEEMVLYARSEQFSEAHSLEDIWRINLRKAFSYLKYKNLFIYIDALEFIADCSKAKMNLLQQIYEIAKDYNNIYIITSCRTSDKKAFINIESKYNIKIYTVSLLSDQQIAKVAKKYNIIQELLNTKKYSQILNSPFYLNFIINKLNDFSKINDVESFRNLIWNEIICMKDKQLPNKVKHSDIRKAVEKITFNRARTFSTGVRKEEIDEDIVTILQSENIITSCSNKTIRLKNDIFEDICFEQFIDDKYDDCKSDYSFFFSEIEQFGRCIYRRYQIWIENKIFSKKNRDKFIYRLLTTDNIPPKWKTQTIIGIVKSNFCSELFEEYEYEFNKDLLSEFIRLTNKFAFEVSIHSLNDGNILSQLKPIGMGRPCLIDLLIKNKMYKDEAEEQAIFKLCTDYSNNPSICSEVAESACSILQFFIEKKMNNLSLKKSIYLADEINQYLLPLYKLSKYSYAWLQKFWSESIKGYLNNDISRASFDKNILKYILKNTVPELAEYLPNELCDVANTYWIKTPIQDQDIHSYKIRNIINTSDFGLSERSDYYPYEFKSINDNKFLYMLTIYNPSKALSWLIDLTNHMAESFKKSNPNNVYDITIWDSSPKKSKSYICNPNFWEVGIFKNAVCELIDDAIYLFTKIVINTINSNHQSKNEIIKFADDIKSEILKNSNNVMMLSIIGEIGRNCIDTIPGYSLFLASNIYLVQLDIQKMNILMPNKAMKLYENSIAQYSGVPGFNNRYKINATKRNSLYEIMLEAQSSELKEKAETILDYLYTSLSKENQNSSLYSLVRDMDLRIDSYNKSSNHQNSSDFQTTNDVQYPGNGNTQDILKIIDKTFTDKLENKSLPLKNCLHLINLFKNISTTIPTRAPAQQTLITLIVYVLEMSDITTSERSEVCNIWLDGINDIFNDKYFVFDVHATNYLYKQIEYDLEDSVKYKMKTQMLNCLLYQGQNGMLFTISSILKNYLMQNKKIAHQLFYTIIGLSEDRLAGYKHDSLKLKDLGLELDYLPNKSKPPIGANDICKDNKEEFYISREDTIIKTYLLEEKIKDISTWDIENCDLETLCFISNCGLDFYDYEFRMVMEKLFPYLLSTISSNYDYSEQLNVHAIHEIKTFISNSLSNQKNDTKIVDMLLNPKNFKKTSRNVYKIYESITYDLFATYVNSYNNKEKRKKCKSTILYIKNKINDICNEKVKNHISKMMFLQVGIFNQYNWNELPTEYSYSDKMFLNEVWSEFGWLHFNDLLNTIYQMNISKLLPEIILPLNITLRKYKEAYLDRNILNDDNKIILNEIITKAFMDFNDDIKGDSNLTEAFEEALNILIDFDISEAAVILDEFRVH